MYYYIFDQPQGNNEYQKIALIKQRLGELGIAGEMTTPVPGRTVEDLVHNAIAKRYATIVVVGGIMLINQVARAIEPYDVVLGIIPLQENSDINQLIGSSTWEEAAEQLKRRRWQPVKLGIMQDSICFLTPASLDIVQGVSYTLSTPDFSLTEKNGATITVTTVRGEGVDHSSLQIVIEPKSGKQKGIFRNLFSSPSAAPTESCFTIDSAVITTTEETSVLVAGEQVTVTPLHLATQKKPVRLIVARQGTSKL